MILRRVARPLLASIFIMGGVNALRQKEGHAEVAKPFLDKAADKTIRRKAGESPESLPGDPVTMVQVDAAVKIAGGTLLALGVLPRVASAMLLSSLVPTTFAVHAFWEEKDPEQRQQQLIEFLKNAGLAGGLLLGVADTGGKPSLGWRARHAADEASHHVQGAAGVVQRKAGVAATKSSMAAEKAAAKAAKAGGKAGKKAGKAGKTAGMVAGGAKGKTKAAKAASLPASAALLKTAKTAGPVLAGKGGKRMRRRVPSITH
ncbi:DoxX family protein [Saccharomonospora xinjiangensis]|uniref:Putative membrane protein n=1 Tax=Saccharomonospora xinjiangensis XJ-54 TaxID=882086 RepID=I0V2P1_9PSEU|nr:DoxX family protein [Saccharomonospora xinjiangensis]EID54394.1 putative membrane protein [Saccharomonospora xinjiangensis XJ-54]